ncbi:BMC domain-containing protein, partial [Rhodovulum sulfidophilum]|uniref:BMC domain-containing protein n=1 Tax=Rhodovulum sulfidophilum TaxID=35806 RepID=UPI0019237096
MTEQSLGLIETIGLAAAVEAADAAVKSANVQLVGYELTNGDGMTVVKLRGEVGAIKAAVAAGAAAAERVNRVVSTQVIARPARDVSLLVDSPATVGTLPPTDPDPDPDGGLAAASGPAAEAGPSPVEAAQPASAEVDTAEAETRAETDAAAASDATGTLASDDTPNTPAEPPTEAAPATGAETAPET